MEPKKLFEYIFYQQENHPLQKSIGRKDGDGWMFYSTQELIDRAFYLAAGLLEIGIKPGDKVSMVAYKNRPEWIVVDLATQMIGVINVPLYPTISSGEYVYILNDAEVTAAFVGDLDLYDKVIAAQKEVPSLKHIYTFDKKEGRPFWEDIYKEGDRSAIENMSRLVDPDDLATIIYTSGTTGKPKGVMLTHTNIVSVVNETFELLPVDEGKQVLSFLPFCHIFERAVIYGYMRGSAIVYCTGTDNLGGPGGDLINIKPYFFTTVPRLLEKVYEKIYNKGLELTGTKKKLFFWALGLTNDYEIGKKFSGLKGIQWKIADKLIFSKWRDSLGGNIQGIVTGAAPCPPKMARVFSAAGIPIREGYGLTETSPTLTVNTFEDDGAMIGTVGPTIPCVELLIDDSDGDYREGEGEILAYGPNVMIGYYNKPEETAAVFKEIDGKKWFRTGDVGKFVSGPSGNQFLKITDRKKELLKTSGGKYVAPAPIENKFKEDFLVEQIMVVGDKRKFVSAIIVPAIEPLKEWCKENGVPWTTISDAIKDEKVLQRFQECCDNFNPEFSHIEQIKKFTLTDKVWEPVKDDGTQAELTPTMKLKRRVILEKHQDEIEKIYKGK
jgi:long-chain acyl-CoA synthetase